MYTKLNRLKKISRRSMPPNPPSKARREAGCIFLPVLSTPPPGPMFEHGFTPLHVYKDLVILPLT